MTEADTRDDCTPDPTSSAAPEVAASEVDNEPLQGELAEPGTRSDEEQAEAAEEAESDPLEVAQAEAAAWKDKCLRTLADFDNFRKRTKRDLVDATRGGREDLLRELLPVFDNLERAAAHAEGASDVKSLADGIAMVMRQFSDTLGKLGVERVASVGQPFDPAVHEAIQQLATAEHQPGTVAAEVQAGYRTPDRLIRPAMVVVAKAPPASEEAGN